jgi:hypothetical protein
VTVDFFVRALAAGALRSAAFEVDALRPFGAAFFFAAGFRVVFLAVFLDTVFFAVFRVVFFGVFFFAVFFAAGRRALEEEEEEEDVLRAVFLTVFLVDFFAVFLAGDFREVFFAAALVEPLDALFFELPREVELRAAVFFAGLMGAGR